MSPGSGTAAAPAPAGQEQSSAAEEDGTATWGERYTWPDGLAVEVSMPKACKPSPMAYPEGVKRAVKLSITVINGTEEEYNAAALAVGQEVQFEGATAEKVFDSNGECGGSMDLGGTVRPGKTFTSSLVVAVGEKPGELQLVLQPEITADKAIFAGQA